MVLRTATERRKPLSELESQVLDKVYEGLSTADAIRLALEPQKVLQDSTVRTILKRLESKGYVRHEKEGRAFVYRALTGQRRLAGGAVRQILDRLCGGSVEQLLLGMVESEIVDEAELKRLAQKIAAARRDRK